MTSAVAVDAPGPGFWSLDTAHFPRPVTRFVSELYAAPARTGFRAATARFGLLIDHIVWAFPARWAYLSPRPVWSPGGERAAPEDEGEWRSLMADEARVSQRLNVSARVFPERRWREDVRAWDERAKPKMVRMNRQLQREPVEHLEGRALLEHLIRCRTNLERAIRTHHRFGVAFAVPAGDFLARARQWTGGDEVELLALLRRGGTGAAPQLDRLGAALDAEPQLAAALVANVPAAEVLSSLRSTPGEAGAAAIGYLDLVGWWSTGGGADVADPCLIEMPELILETVRAAIDGRRRRTPEGEVEAFRDRVSESRRAAFDDALAEARAAHRLRDERAVFCDVWAFGLCRRAMLAAGRRLRDGGLLEDPAHLVEAGFDEIAAVILRQGGPDGAELAARAEHRASARAEDVPLSLGAPGRPVPLAWLAEGAARTERAFRTYVRAMSEQNGRLATASEVAGIAASPGRYEGRARVVADASELAQVRRGDVLVVEATTPAFNPVLPLAGAIVTDRGGVLSHAAIVAREYRIPAVVGTGDATLRIPDGAAVAVDGSGGCVRILSVAGQPESDPKRSR